MNESIETCTRCFFPYGRAITYPDPIKHCRIMVVGQSPSSDRELDEKRPTLRDSDGAILFNRILKELKLNVDDFYHTNLIKCTSREVEGKEGSADNCFPFFLEQEIEQVNPEIIIALGTKVYGYLKSKDINKKFDLREVYHPAFILRGGYLKGGHTVTEKEYAEQLRLAFI